MSEENEAVTCCCASCGITEIDDITLVECDDCDLVKYCSDECREDHKLEHEEACKKRAAELRDELLFKQPERSHHGDCPICDLPLSLDYAKSRMYQCCSKVICDGCVFANQKREREQRLQYTCPFCRTPLLINEEERVSRNVKRAEANDPIALCKVGSKHCEKGEYQSGFEYYTKAAQLGYAEAHYKLSAMYENGLGVDKDKGEEVHHMEKAAIGGHPKARYALGCHEYMNGNIERAVKHWIIAAKQGEDKSIKLLMEAFKQGEVEKEDLTAALRAQKAAVDATKSPQREAAELARRNRF